MAKAQLKCPGCQSTVDIGDVECKVCGLNLKSGEALETRVRKAKGKAIHPEHFGGRLYLGVVLAFGLAVFGGYMFQTQAVDVSFVERQDLYWYAVDELQRIGDLVTAGQREAAQGNVEAAQKDYQNARKRADALINWLGRTVDLIRPEDLYGKEAPGSMWNPEPSYHKRTAIVVLGILKAKAEYVRDHIPAA